MVAWGAIAAGVGSALSGLMKNSSFWGQIGGAGISTIGNLVGTGINEKVARKLMEMQIAWQTHMAQNAHQYEVEDLKKAGLNPILSAGGDGASYTGISGTSSESQLGQQAVAMANAIKNTMADTILKEEQTRNTGTDTIVKEETARLIGQQVFTQKTQAELNAAQAQLATAEAMLSSGRNSREQQKMAYEMKNLASQTILNMAGVRNINSQIQLNKATEKYTNERARGFSQTYTNTDGYGFGAFSANYNAHKGATQSKTW